VLKVVKEWRGVGEKERNQHNQDAKYLNGIKTYISKCWTSCGSTVFCGKNQFTLEVQHIIQSLHRIEAFSTTTFPPLKRQMLCQTKLQFFS
jgi:hypothetical protein